MADSLLMDGIDDVRGFSAGSFAGNGAMSCVVIARATDVGSAYNWIVGRDAGGTNGNALGFTNNGNLSFFNGTSEPSSPFAVPANDEWYLFGMSKASGFGVVRFHLYRYTTTVWDHADSLGFSDPMPAAWTNIGYCRSPSEHFEGSLLIGGLWDSVISDATVEGLIFYKGAWTIAAPDEAVRFDTAGTITPFVGTGSQNAQAGGTLDTGSVPVGWSEGDPPPPPPVIQTDVSKPMKVSVY